MVLYIVPFSSLLPPLSHPPHSSLLTPHSSLLTPHSSLLTPHSSLLTPHSSLRTPHSSLLTPSLLTHNITLIKDSNGRESCTMCPIEKVAAEGVGTTINQIRKQAINAGLITFRVHILSPVTGAEVELKKWGCTCFIKMFIL
jgi:hypothetical protein